jgi:hypothetical protein
MFDSKLSYKNRSLKKKLQFFFYEKAACGLLFIDIRKRVEDEFLLAWWHSLPKYCQIELFRIP